MYAGVAGSPPAGRRIAREVQTAMELVMAVMNAQAMANKLGCADKPQVSVGIDGKAQQRRGRGEMISTHPHKTLEAF